MLFLFFCFSPKTEILAHGSNAFSMKARIAHYSSLINYMSLTQKVFYNTVIQIVGKVIATAISVLTVMVLTRYLGASGYGDYATILTYLGFAGIVVDMGFYTITVREISKPNANISQIVGNVLGLRTFLSVLLFGGAIGVVFLLPYSIIIKVGVAIAALGYLFISLRQIGVSVFQAKLRMDRNVVIDVLTRFLDLVFIFILMKLGCGIWAVMGALVVANGITFLLCLILAKRFTTIHFRFEKEIWKRLFLEAVPMAIALVLIKIYFQIDVILLSFLKGSYDVGIYSAAYKVLEVLITVPAMFVGSVLPSLTFHAVQRNFDRIKRLFQRSFDALILMGLPITVGGMILARPLMNLVAGKQFAGSDQVLFWILVAMSFIFVSNLMGSVMVAFHRQQRLIWQGALGVVVNIGLNLILIPRYSYLGAAIATVITEGLILILMTTMVGIELKLWPKLFNPLKIIFSAGLMGIVVYGLSQFNLIIPVLGGALVYFALLYLFRIINRDLILAILRTTK